MATPEGAQAAIQGMAGKDMKGRALTVNEARPRVDIDVPTPRARSTPESVRAATLAALRAGAQGVLLSRAYLEMKPENLRGAGQALEEFGAV